ncbi:hypothetical protein RDWZM_000360 [Blomia tropicalis]|uniref:alpha-1,2-Mannosidase n=1 Tax=Blomia tropicalis TaxID=40697 RepID=A0A9Q0RPQ0_BLOTA|nr:hypothetical protein RDWZM_000360 [Blomia tropicalis]
MEDKNSETEKLHCKEGVRENFELEIDPKLYVWDKYFYRDRRFKIALYIFLIILIISLILTLVLFYIRPIHYYDPWNYDDKNGSTTKSFKQLVSDFSKKQSSTEYDQNDYKNTTATELSPKNTLKKDPQTILRKKFIKKIAYKVWDRYERYAWGQDTLRPLTKEYSFHKYGINSGLTIVTSLSTLWIMGMTEQFDRGRQWIENNLHFNQINQYVNVHDTITQFVGSLLSCYALTDDPMFRDKALEIAERLELAYHPITGLPYGEFIPSTGLVTDTTPNLSTIGGQQLEYRFLSEITGIRKFYNRVQLIQNRLHTIKKVDGLYRKQMYVETGQWVNELVTFAKPCSIFYSSLIKSTIRSKWNDTLSMKMYVDAIEAAFKMDLFPISRNGLQFVRNYHQAGKKYGDFMNYDSCYIGAMLALGASARKHFLSYNSEHIKTEMNLAESITRTCHEASIRSKSGLPPHHFYFNHAEEATNMRSTHQEFHLSSELMESYFVLWRLTGNKQYREFAWELFESITLNCETENGFSNVQNVNHEPIHLNNYQDATFLAATLKYLYLIFTDKDDDEVENSHSKLILLDEWVFNSFGQPFPVKK